MPGALAAIAENAARAGSKKTTASAAIAPSLVAPNDSTSMPARQVVCAGGREPHQGIGEARAIHVHGKPGRARVGKRAISSAR